MSAIPSGKGSPAPGVKAKSGTKPAAKGAIRKSVISGGGHPVRLRLIDAVTLAAVGLLVLKLGALLSIPPTPPGETARSLVQARAFDDLFDPVTTGSVTPKAETKPAESKPAEPPVYQPAIPDTVSPSERALLEKLAARREALKQRSEALDQREQMLQAAERKLETGTADLKVAEDRAEGGSAKKAESEKAGLKSIVTMYETMKPKDAARVFDRLGHDVLVPIVLAMNPRKMAEVLAVMGSEPAERLTVALANRARGVEVASAAAPSGLPAGELPAIEPTPTRSTP